MKEEIDISVMELWDEFINYNSEYRNKPLPEIMYFCDNKKDADECTQLVADGKKKPLQLLNSGMKPINTIFLKLDIFTLSRIGREKQRQ